ncbi:MAG: glutathione S-transferase [Burkholderiales bacterium]|nr:glutathione S-transferase [Burkholderiales bacterium]
MLKLCGFAVSNYYNKVKIALLEKGVPFEEELVWTSQKEDMLRRSPMGKVPFIETAHGNLSESSVINEYIEEAYPQTPLFPADPWQRAKVRELTNLLDMHLELQARRLYAGAFFGGTVSEEAKAEVRKELDKGVRALAGMAVFGPFIAGASLTYADCAAYVHLPLIAAASKWAYGADALAGIAGVRPYLAMMKARPHIQKVDADRKASLELMAQRNKA